jgi:DNA-binding transcriptional MocR family regulator
MLELAAMWTEDGTIDRRIAWQRTELIARGRIADALGNGPASPHRWFPTLTAPDRAAALARDAGVVIVSSDALSVGARSPKGIRVSISAAASRSELHDAIMRLSASGISFAELVAPG